MTNYRVILGEGAEWRPSEEEEITEVEITVSPIAPDECRLVIEGADKSKVTRDREILSAQSKYDLDSKGAAVTIENVKPTIFAYTTRVDRRVVGDISGVK